MSVRVALYFIVLLTAQGAIAQSWDSVNLHLPSDTLFQNSIQKADSITQTFTTSVDSLNEVYQRNLNKITQTQNLLQHQLDSLQNLKLPTEKLSGKLDSLKQVGDEQINSLTNKIEELKTRTTQQLEEINLPPQLQEPMQKLHASITGYSVPALDFSAPDLSNLNLSGEKVRLPTLTDQIKLDSNLKDFTIDVGKISGLTNQVGQYTQDIQNLAKGNLDEIKSLDKALENKLASMEGVDQLTEGKALFAEYSQIDSAWVKEQAKALVQEQITAIAQNHFAGKQEVLQQAMDKLKKLKGRYSELKSMAELPKKLPNPLKSKPFIERLLPGISFQIQNSDYFLMDINPYLMYQITPRFSAGAGWNHRLPMDDWRVAKTERIYGPRAAFELKWTKGINFRLLPELMYTAIPTNVKSNTNDPAYKEWVPSVFVGIKKDFTVYKTIKGNTEVLYNLYDKDNKSPYGDRLSIRFGFEFPMKKRLRQRN